jgi:hypothetical protein
MRRLLVFLFLSTHAFGAFSYYRTLTIDHTKCGSANSSSFPVLVSINHSSFKTVANGGRVQNSNGYDIIFTSDSGGTTKIPWEVESYDGTTGVLVAWVNIPSVSHTTDTVFYVWYGGASISTAQNTGSYSPENVWDANYKGVWHLTSLNINDSTSNAHNGSLIGNPTATTGKIGGGMAVTGSNRTDVSSPIAGNYFDVSTDFGSTTVMAEFWLYLIGGTHRGIMASGPNNGVPALAVSINSDNRLDAFRGSDTTTTNPLSTGVWIHAVIVNDGSNTLYYLNGSLSNSAAQTITPAMQSTFHVGANYWGSFEGSIDEFRISNSVRSDSWVLTSYNNQNAPGNIGADNFLKYGAENTPPPPAGGMIRHRVIGGE